MDGDPTLDVYHHLILDAGVGKGAAHHHLVIAAPRTIGIEVVLADAMLGEVSARRAVMPDRAGRRDVVGGDGIEEQAENARVDNVGDRLRAVGDMSAK